MLQRRTRNKMRMKSVIYTIAISIVIMIVLLGFAYDFQVSLVSVSDVVFVTGIFLFFPGVIIMTGAGQVFESCNYLTRKVFTKESVGNFKTLGDYKEYKKLNHIDRNRRGRGLMFLGLGGTYIALSLVMSFLS